MSTNITAMFVGNVTATTPSSTLLAAAELLPGPIRCACDSFQHRCLPGLDYCLTNYTCFTALIHDDDDGDDVTTMGCMGHRESADMNCHVGSHNALSIVCCKTGDYCNRRLVPVYTSTDSIALNHESSAVEMPLDTTLQLALYTALILVIILVVCVLAAWRIIHLRHIRKLKEISKRERIVALGIEDLQVSPMGESTIKTLYDLSSCTSGSGGSGGSGVPLLTHTTIARTIQLIELISQGRFGSVWRGVYQGEDVAVKVFPSRAEASWRRESAIYNGVPLRHDNVLGFIAADVVSTHDFASTQLWLVVKYHPCGSLYDYLRRQTGGVSPGELLRLLSSAARGLCYLHTEIIGTSGKPSVAHRDIKSRNILIMSDGRACVADLGLAVTNSTSRGCRGHPLAGVSAGAWSSVRVGTIRYMAPEVLDESLNTTVFDSFRAADVYSFGLVVWEVSLRCPVAGLIDDCQQPYSDCVPTNPSFDCMRRVVCTNQQRPFTPERWSQSAMLRSVRQLMTECWHAKSSARPTMLRIRKTLDKLSKSIGDFETKETPLLEAYRKY